MKEDSKEFNVLFVCMGNICRSPMAHGVFLSLIRKHRLQPVIGVDSAGTHAYHIGEPPDPRASDIASTRGYDLEHLRARRVGAPDIAEFDLILVMDHQNQRDVLRLCTEDQKDKVRLLLDFALNAGTEEVPDPYYGGTKGFETVLDLVEDACQGLLEHISKHHCLKISV
ncbi:MAG: low molecular weight phosphotyrosine protein phosphatase [Gammaproteobacteria bacterium]|nr:low molecular weight phosphotyrosine protein phosphatase [Gammaproteobacteria bacterium]